MKFSSFFIDRPVFAAVLSAFITIAGAIALFKLPVSEYPEVVPPSVVVRAAYPGANPKVISETVAAPLEQEIVGVEDMLYMSSQATMDGSLALTVTFRIGTDIDRAQVQVQNRVAQALPRLPEDVRAIGVSTLKSTPAFLMVVHLTSPDGRYDSLYLRNYATLNVRDLLARIPGVGDVRVFGAGDYAMRVWLDPQKMSARDLTTGDVVARDPRAERAGGRRPDRRTAGGGLGIPARAECPGPPRDRRKNSATWWSRPARTAKSCSCATSRASSSAPPPTPCSPMLGNENAVAIPVYQSPGSNALELSNKVRADMDELKKSFPQGMDYKIIYDPTQFVRQSIDAVIETLLEAVLLVVLVVILFLQTWRASVIPLVAVPVSIIGTFAVLYALGFSINTLSLFGLVLAIGIVVDDSIVVVENVERHIANGLKPLEATKKAMSEVSRPIIAITLVLSAVFIPVAFVARPHRPVLQAVRADHRGLDHHLGVQLADVVAGAGRRAAQAAWREARCADARHGQGVRPLLRALQPAVRRSPVMRTQRGVDAHREARAHRDRHLRGPGRAHLVRLPCARRRASFRSRTSCTWSAWCSCRRRPRSSAPARSCAASARSPRPSRACWTPCSSPASRPMASRRSRARRWCSSRSRTSTSARASTAGAIAGSLNQKFASIQDAYIAVFPPPPVIGLGTLGGFKLNVEDRQNRGAEALYAAVQDALQKAWADPSLAGVFSSYQINVPQLDVDVDRLKVKRQGVMLNDVFQTLQVNLGSLYVNDFNRFGRTYRVVAQADAPFRSQVDDILPLKTRNAAGEMVPLGSMITIKESFGPDIVERFNGYPSADINGGPSPGHSSGQAQAAIAKILDENLPAGMSYEWTDLAYPADRRRRCGAVRVPAVRAVRVPGAGGAVRELHAAAGHHPDRADGVARRPGRHLSCRVATTTSSRRSASWCWSGWRPRTPS